MGWLSLLGVAKGGEYKIGGQREEGRSGMWDQWGDGLGVGLCEL